jgi:hypothetical protein
VNLGPSPADESFESLRVAQQTLEKLGWHFFPIPKEHAEGLVTGPLLQRIRTQINKRGFGKMAGRAIITFSGLFHDPREVFAIPEVRAYWRQLNQQLPELPALLGMLPEMGYNGPGMHLTLLGEIDEIIDRPLALMYDLHVVEGEKLLDDALRRIRQAARKYNLKPNVTQTVIGQFTAGATARW